MEGWKFALDRTILYSKLVQLLVDKAVQGGHQAGKYGNMEACYVIRDAFSSSRFAN
jgi:hypothetical protein